MAKENVALLAFNRGIISSKGLARVDLDRTRLSAETQTNYIPRVLGSMMMRPGLKYIAASESNNTAIHIPFVYAIDDTAYIQVTDQNMRVYVNDSPISRPSVSSSVTNGNFTTDLSSWTDADEGTATSTHDAAGYMALLGTGFDAAIRRQQITVSGADQGTQHGIRVTVQRGPIDILVGSTSGSDDYFRETLGTGTHSLAFTPTGNFFIEFQSALDYTVLIDSVSIESSGTQDLPSPWLEADIKSIRWDQSADVIFVACNGYQQRRIERRGTTSWSIVKYEPNTGPFRNINTTNITLTPSALSGDITISASDSVFKSGNVGSLYRIESIGQTVELDATTDGVFSDAIRVTGVDNSRIFDITVSGTWSGTVTVQRSINEEGSWSDVSGLSYTGNTTTTHDDGLDNQVAFYRIGIKSGDYTSGTAELQLSYGSGSNAGVARITAVNSTTSADAVVLEDFGGTDASTNWYESQWSDRRGWPSSVSFHEGRLGWFGKGRAILSESDAFDVFDLETEGDSAYIDKSLGSGPVDRTYWSFSGNRLMVGTASAEVSIRSSSFDEPLTPTAFNIRKPSTQGSANVPIVDIDAMGIFVQSGGTSIYKLSYSDTASTLYDYTSNEVTTLVPEIGDPSVERLAVQRQPDTRIHAVRGDGKVALWVNDPGEDVSCWVLVETDGEVEDAFVIPSGADEDDVYYFVKRTINGATKRYLEKWALESECVGGTVNKVADSFITYSGSSTTSITGLDHLEGESVVVWGDGDFNGTYTVSSGAITLSTAVSEAVIGLSYTAKFKSAKLAYAAQFGTSLNQVKKVTQLGLVLENTHKDAIKYGPTFNAADLDPMPPIENGTTLSDGFVHSVYDEVTFPFDGNYDTDSRICLQTTAPYPATVLACVLGIETHEKI